MKGLCQECLSSNVEVKIYGSRFVCISCGENEAEEKLKSV